MEKKKRKLKFCLNRWRCMNFWMRHAAAAADKKKKKKKKRSGDDEVIRVSKQRKKNEIQNLGDPGDNTSADTIVGGGTTANIRRKMENVEMTERSGEPKSSTRTREPVVEFENMENYKNKCFELSMELENKKVELEKKKVECTELQGWRKMFSDLESRFLRIKNSNSTMGERVESCISKLERMENENSKMGCLESRISKVESLVRRWVELHNSENIESEAQGLQNGVTQSGEKQRDENKRSTPNAETSSRGEKDSCVCLHLSSGAENLEEWKGWGYSEDRPSQHGSSSQDHLEMSKEQKIQKMSTIFSNLASDVEDSGESVAESEDSDSSADSQDSLDGIIWTCL